jgi:hypothetical protein
LVKSSRAASAAANSRNSTLDPQAARPTLFLAPCSGLDAGFTAASSDQLLAHQTPRFRVLGGPLPDAPERLLPLPVFL